MVSCSICGKKNSSCLAKIEGTVIEACGECARFGKIIETFRPQKIKKKIIVEEKPTVEEFVSFDYSKKIRNVREKNDMTQEEFAKKLNEKLSIIRQIEHGTYVPDLKLAKKIESSFNIKLIEEQKEVSGFSPVSKNKTEVTIGDMIQIKKRK